MSERIRLDLALEQRGLVPLAGADLEAANKQASELKPLDPAGLK